MSFFQYLKARRWKFLLTAQALATAGLIVTRRERIRVSEGSISQRSSSKVTDRGGATPFQH